MSVAAAELVEPAYFSRPDRVGSYGDEAIDLAVLAGLDPDAEQRQGIDAMLSFGPGGRWVALESLILEGRQNGKTTGELEPVVLFDLFLLPPDRIVWTAHLFKTARDAFGDFCRVIAATPELSRRVKRIAYANGEESIELHSGALLEFLARSKGGGRGLGGKRVVFDEALFLSGESMGALIPTLAARGDPQINYASSGAYSTSTHLKGLVKRGRAGQDPSLIYKEFCADGSWRDPGCAQGVACSHVVGMPGCSLDDEAKWAQANHTLGRRISIGYVRNERRALPPDEFGRERLGWHDDAAGTALDPDRIPEAKWKACTDPGSAPVGPVVFSIDMPPDGSACSIGVAGRRADGLAHIGVVAYGRGTAWAPGRLAELVEEHDTACGVVWQPTAPVGALRPQLEKTPGLNLLPITQENMAEACGGLKAHVVDGTVRHQGADILDAAFAAAERRVSVEGSWVFGRRKSAGDISPLVAAGEALYGLVMFGDGEPSVYSF